MKREFKTVDWGELTESQKNQATVKLKQIGADVVTERRKFKYAVFTDTGDVRSVIEGL